ncbi:MAG: hypothetical protein WD030_03445 [Pirellulales bacterium]
MRCLLMAFACLCASFLPTHPAAGDEKFSQRETSLICDEFNLAVLIDVPALLKSDQGRRLLECDFGSLVPNGWAERGRHAELALDNIETITLLSPVHKEEDDFSYFLTRRFAVQAWTIQVTLKHPLSIEKFVEALPPEAEKKKRRKRVYYDLNEMFGKSSVYMTPARTTVLFTRQHDMPEILDAVDETEEIKQQLREQVGRAPAGDIIVCLNVSNWFPRLPDRWRERYRNEYKDVSGLYMPLAFYTQAMTARIDLGEQVHVSACFQPLDGVSLDQLEKKVEAWRNPVLKELRANYIDLTEELTDDDRKQIDHFVSRLRGPTARRVVSLNLPRLLSTILDDMEIRQLDDQVQLQTKSPEPVSGAVDEWLARLEVAKERESEHWKIERISNGALRYRVYEECPLPYATEHLLTDKPQLSWRVLLLPYVAGNGLYREFKLDQPWDAPQNKKLISKMPDFYATAELPPGFSNLRAIRLKDGGMVIVETSPKHAVEWTRPDPLEPTLESWPLDIGWPEDYEAAIIYDDGGTFRISKGLSRKEFERMFGENKPGKP